MAVAIVDIVLLEKEVACDIRSVGIEETLINKSS
jgi:hypothetical protein